MFIDIPAHQSHRNFFAIEELHTSGKYNELAKRVLEFKLSVQVFDPFGLPLNYDDFTMMSDNDIDRQLRNADIALGSYGFHNYYGHRYYDEDDPNSYKIDCILFAADEICRTKLGEYAKAKLNEFVNQYRLVVVNRSDECKRKYHNILADSDVISKQLFTVPEHISVREDPEGIDYDNHLLASPETGLARIKLNGWEASLIEEEARRNDFVCWLRNQSKVSWSMCLPYKINGEIKKFYPDFLIVRSDANLEYIVDILEPHGNQYTDNLPKAKALAEYAKEEDRIGRIQLIHKTTDAGGNNRFVRLDLTDITVSEKVLNAVSNEELDHLFDIYGIY